MGVQLLLTFLEVAQLAPLLLFDTPAFTAHGTTCQQQTLDLASSSSACVFSLGVSPWAHPAAIGHSPNSFLAVGAVWVAVVCLCAGLAYLVGSNFQRRDAQLAWTSFVLKAFIAVYVTFGFVFGGALAG